MIILNNDKFNQKILSDKIKINNLKLEPKEIDSIIIETATNFNIAANKNIYNNYQNYILIKVIQI